MSRVAIVARATVKEGKAEEYITAFAWLLEQAEKEPGALLYAVHRSKHDPFVFWTTEVYADEEAFAVHSMPLPRRCTRTPDIERCFMQGLGGI